ncbi:hyaluronate lyase [Austwickia chelonae]|uniref:Hyaluronate lyase n=1 Tax=Austwickia chelonae NBRC 105200 TaxID=1184607 RepID=K6W6V7_9MICO|nr:polysaccharide lyase 8 family protein [Austwickia chelonae]GAB77557.1 hypothetical protein AUCHE_05_04700 [Austwickia chelonae NBRC 105200]SEW12838.1 hyaluronate lyase [Austwickia chelonae]
MTKIPRRSVLKGLSGLTAMGMLPSAGSASAPGAAPAADPPELRLLRERWVDSLTGRAMIRAAPGAFAAAIGKLDKAVSDRSSKIAPTGTRYFSHHDWSVGKNPSENSESMRATYVDLALMARAWATPGSKYSGSGATLAAVLAGLEHMDKNVYHAQAQWTGNWWSWAIGAARPLSDIMAILRSELTSAQITRYCTAIDHFVPRRDPTMQIHPNGPQRSEGANRVDICQALIVRAAVGGDVDLLRACVAALSPTWQYVSSGNGFFEDGSFVQHSTIGYTGTYGLVLLGGLSRLFALLAGTPYEVTDPSRKNVWAAVDHSFAPLMYRGQMMDAVRGRAVSRAQERSIDNGDQLVETVLRLARSADPATAARWRGLCRQWIEGSASKIRSSTDVERLALVTELMASDVAQVRDRTGPVFFPAMDRMVYRGTDNNWALCLAMCSRRIAWHEGSPAENFAGARTSQGMTYLYLPSDDRHFDDDYWATFDLDAPPGTTVDLAPLGRNPEGEWGSRTPQNEWTGGTVLGDVALAGMHLLAPGGTGLTARKTWLMLPGQVVALGSDISSSAGHEVRTVVEHRNLGDAAGRLQVDGTAVTQRRSLSGARWAHLEKVGGYLFLGAVPALSAEVAARTGEWQRNNTGRMPGSEGPRSRRFATLAFVHGSGPISGASYAYVLLPGADEATTRARREDPGVEILANSGTAQALKIRGGLLAVNFWKAGTVAGYSASAPLCLVSRRSDRSVDLSVSDPTQKARSVTLTVADTTTASVAGPDADRIRLRRDGGQTVLTVDVSGRAGRSMLFTLKP